ncbi:MAG: hypothetical protein K2H22_05035 [Muribaculaceae bacterium]|nr:hypothetical protein [Muribaculaceae bacterium]
MKKILLSSLIAAAAAVPAFAGVDNINYQAVIKNGSNVVANTEVAMKFELLDKAETVVYSEEQSQKTNASGYVACQLGKDDALSTIEWGDLTLRVSVNLGNGFEIISNEAVSSVPTALYALRSADSDEIKEVVEELMLDNESTKTSLIGVNAELVKLNGFVEEVDAFNTDLVEKLEPMMGLNYEEVNDFHQRVSETLLALNENVDEMFTNTDAFATMVEGRFDSLQKLIENTDNDLENIKENLTNAFEAKDAEIAEINAQLENLNQVGAVVRANEEAIEQLNTSVESFATMVEGRFDKVEKELGDTQTKVDEIESLKAKIADLEEELDTLRQGMLEIMKVIQGEDFNEPTPLK